MPYFHIYEQISYFVTSSGREGRWRNIYTKVWRKRLYICSGIIQESYKLFLASVHIDTLQLCGNTHTQQQQQQQQQKQKNTQKTITTNRKFRLLTTRFETGEWGWEWS